MKMTSVLTCVQPLEQAQISVGQWNSYIVGQEWPEVRCHLQTADKMFSFLVSAEHIERAGVHWVTPWLFIPPDLVSKGAKTIADYKTVLTLGMMNIQFVIKDESIRH